VAAAVGTEDKLRPAQGQNQHDPHTWLVHEGIVALYSPDLNPIEQIFSKLKRLLRKANERTVKATSRRIGQLLDTFAPGECQNDIQHAGYASI
jgi:hypothetical protein